MLGHRVLVIFRTVHLDFRPDIWVYQAWNLGFDPGTPGYDPVRNESVFGFFETRKFEFRVVPSFYFYFFLQSSRWCE